jgi:hypothetical protein
LAAAFLLEVKWRQWQETERLLAIIFEALAFNALAISMTIFLASLFLKKADALHHMTSPFEGNSYGIYWLHQIILMPLLFVIKPLRIPIGIKWGLAIPVTVFVCFALSKLSGWRPRGRRSFS